MQARARVPRPRGRSPRRWFDEEYLPGRRAAARGATCIGGRETETDAYLRVVLRPLPPDAHAGVERRGPSPASVAGADRVSRVRPGRRSSPASSPRPRSARFAPSWRSKKWSLERVEPELSPSRPRARPLAASSRATARLPRRRRACPPRPSPRRAPPARRSSTPLALDREVGVDLRAHRLDQRRSARRRSTPPSRRSPTSAASSKSSGRMPAIRPRRCARRPARSVGERHLAERQLHVAALDVARARSSSPASR